MTKDPIKQALRTFSKQDITEFVRFIKRQKTVKERKDVKLIKILSEKKSERLNSADIQTLLYGKENKRSYYELRSRVMEQLTEFISVKRIEDDLSKETLVSAVLSYAHYLMEHELYHSGWKMLRKAERMGLENNLYSILLNVYQAQVQYAYLKAAPPLNHILKLQKANLEYYKKELELQTATTRITILLENFKSSGRGKGIRSIVNNTLDEHGVSREAVLNLKSLDKLMTISRKVAMAKKAYGEFEEMIIPQVEKMWNDYDLKSKDQRFILHLLYMASHILYRNRKFDLSLQYIDHFETYLNSHKTHFTTFYPKFVLLKAAVLSYMGRNDESIDMLEKALDQEVENIHKYQKNNMKVNLAVYYFQMGQFNKSLGILGGIVSSNKKLIEQMGREWTARMRLIELVTLHELGEKDWVNKRIKSFNKTFSKMLKNPMYKRMSTFLKLIRQSNDHPDWQESPAFVKRMKQILDEFPPEHHDILAVAFYCWLKSKIEEKSYYQVLVETISQKNDENLKIEREN